MSVHTFTPKNSIEETRLPETEFYRGYNVISRVERLKSVGEIFLKGVRVAYCETTKAATSLQHLRDIVDKLIQDKTCERKNAVPSKAELSEAIQDAFPCISLAEQKLLTHFQTMDKHEFSLDELQLVCDCQSTTEVSLLLAQLGRLLCDIVGFEPPTPFDGRDPFLALIVSSSENCPNQKKPVTLNLNPNFTLALSTITRPLN